MRDVLWRLVLVGVLGTAGAAAQPVPPVPPHKAETKPAVKAKPGPAHPKPVSTARHPARPVAPPAPAVAAAPAEPAPDKEAEPGKGSNTGNPLPRFATLRSDEVNLRTGPGTRYPIDWVYKRRDLPVLIEREFDAWRLVRDQEGIKGWVHQATLAPRRTGVVVGEERMLRADKRDDAEVIARLKPGVIVRLRSCEQGADWCQATVQDYRGWIRRSDVWGLLPGEVVQ